MRWFNRYNFPYSNFHDLNLDWILKEMTRIREEWEGIKEAWEQMKIDWETFQAEMQRLWREYQALMAAEWQAFKSGLEGEWEDYQAQLDEAWDLFQQEMEQAWTTYQSTINGQMSDLQQAWTSFQSSVNSSLSSMQTQINNFITQMENHITQNLPTIAQPLIEDWLDNIDPSTFSSDIPITTPEQHGAVGDGVTNDYVAIIDCFNDAYLHGKAVMFGAGKRYVADPQNLDGYPVALTYYSNGHIFGNGAEILGNVILRFVGIGLGSVCESLTVKEIQVELMDGWEFKNCRCSILKVGTDTGDQPVRNCVFENCIISKFASVYGSSDNSFSNITFRDCEFGGESTIPCLELFGARGVLVEGCKFNTTTNVFNYKFNDTVAGCDVIFDNMIFSEDSQTARIRTIPDNFSSGDVGVESRLRIGLSNFDFIISNLGKFDCRKVSLTSL